MTSSAIRPRENPSALPHDRQAEFSNARRCPQFGQWKSRMQRITFEGHDIDRNVDHTVLGVGVDDAA
ncbi:Uncharacterised protein [Mycobacterium tuberculosis]|nr:Uncharacterised protein [Mycobacterium tuberculosis]COX60033.1 Uncharacterised protein [Mycobacterium tuberculosis]